MCAVWVGGWVGLSNMCSVSVCTALEAFIAFVIDIIFRGRKCIHEHY